VELETPLPQESVPLETPHDPLEEVIVKELVEPESVYVARVWVDHVAPERRPPVLEPDDLRAVIVALAGSAPEPLG